MKEEKLLYGRGYGMLFRVLLVLSLLLLLALSPLAAWPTGQDAGKDSAQDTAMTEERTPEGQSQSNISGTASSQSSIEQLISQRESTSETEEKASEGKRLSRDESAELYYMLLEARDVAGALRDASDAKDDEIQSLKADLAKAEREAGTKPYLMLDGIVGFDDMKPEFGVGLTVGARIGNDFMVEVGADYMIGTLDRYNNIGSLDSWEFRAGIGWMF